MENVIETKELTMAFGDKVAVDNLTLSIPKGGIHAMVGSNGAGKTTLFHMLLGMKTPISGRSSILGVDSSQLDYVTRAKIGFVNDTHTLPPWMKVDALMKMQRSVYPKWKQELYYEVIGNFNISGQDKIANLSRGERAGVCLALALAQNPEVLLLDEPALGLDVVAKHHFIESLIMAQDATNQTTLYCSHQMEEVERVADSFIIMEQGEMTNVSSPKDFRNRVSHWVADLPAIEVEQASIPGHLVSTFQANMHHITVIDQGPDFADYLRSKGGKNIQLEDISLEKALIAFLSKNHHLSDGRI